MRSTRPTSILQKLEQSKLSVSRQIEKWDNYSVALNALLGPISGDCRTFGPARQPGGAGYGNPVHPLRSLPGAPRRTPKTGWNPQALCQPVAGISAIHPGEGTSMPTRESFVFLKRIGSEHEENREPPIAAQRIRVGKGGSYDAIVRPNSWYEAWMLEPTTLVIGCTTFISPRNGGNGFVTIPLCHDDRGMPTMITSPTEENASSAPTRTNPTPTGMAFPTGLKSSTAPILVGVTRYLLVSSPPFLLLMERSPTL